MNIIEFSKSVGLELYPVQKVVLKALYGLKLDDTQKLEVSDSARTNPKFLSETDYLKFLFDDGRSSIEKVDEGKSYSLLALSTGRRGGKSLLGSLVIAYEASELLKRDCPQDRYGLPPSQGINFLTVAPCLNGRYAHDEAYKLLGEAREGLLHNVSHRVDRAEYQTYNDMKTQGHRRDNPNARASVALRFKTAGTKSFRGLAALVTVLDEFAYFSDQGQSSAQQVYNCVAPMGVVFSPKDPADKYRSTGPIESKILLLSSPSPEGLFFEMFFRGSFATDLCLRIPTWEMNPHIPASEFDLQKTHSLARFNQEYGAEFSTH